MRATFGAILKSYRKKHNLTQTDLAHAVGIHPTYIGKLETSTTMRGPSDGIMLVYRLAQVLEADAGELLEVLGKVTPDHVAAENERLRRRVSELEQKVRELGGVL